ncbi:MAG: hypothetical protein U0325_28200 [Polyangiales bacterium]
MARRSMAARRAPLARRGVGCDGIRRAVWLCLALAGCASRWSGCRRYTAAETAGEGFHARVLCAPATALRSVSPQGRSSLGGCTTRWQMEVTRGREARRATLWGASFASPDCGAVRGHCATARGEIAQRATAHGAWVGGRAPGGATQLAFVPARCGSTYFVPGDGDRRAPGEAVAAQPDGDAFLDGVVQRDGILSEAWRLVCDDVLGARRVAVRGAMLQCRTPDAVTDALLRGDPASVDAAWSALLAGTIPCAPRLRRLLREAAAEALGTLALAALAADAASATPRAVPLITAGELRLRAAWPSIARIAARPAPAAGGAAFAAWRAAHQALVRIDPVRGAEVALAHLRASDPPTGSTRRPARVDPDVSDPHEAPAAALCDVLREADATTAREGLWRVAGDPGAAVGARQHALLTLAALGDRRARDATPATAPLTDAQRDAVDQWLRPPSASGTGRHHHHWH